jgi:hypothetical protein
VMSHTQEGSRSATHWTLCDGETDVQSSQCSQHLVIGGYYSMVARYHILRNAGRSAHVITSPAAMLFIDRIAYRSTAIFPIFS